MLPPCEPLLDVNGHKEGGHGKINPRRIKRQNRAQQGTNRAARHPIELVKQGQEKIIPMGIDPLGNAVNAGQGLGFVGQRVHQIQFFAARALITFDHGEAVKQMPRVYH